MLVLRLKIKNAKFYTSDLESVSGKYDIVTCIDVAIHYPTDKMSEMVTHLCSLSKDRVLELAELDELLAHYKQIGLDVNVLDSARGKAKKSLDKATQAIRTIK